MERIKLHKKILIGLLNAGIVAGIGFLFLFYTPVSPAKPTKPDQLFQSRAVTVKVHSPSPTPTPTQVVAQAPAPRVSIQKAVAVATPASPPKPSQTQVASSSLNGSSGLSKKHHKISLVDSHSLDSIDALLLPSLFYGSD